MQFAYIGPAKDKKEALERLLAHHDFIAVDTETIGLKGDKATTIPDWDDDGNLTPQKAFLDARTCIGVGIAISPTEGFYFPLGNGTWKNVPLVDTYPLFKKLDRPEETKIFFNSLFDLDRIEDRLEIKIDNFHDVAIGCQVQGLWNSLDQNSGHLLGESHMVIDDVLPKGKTMLDVPFEKTAKKCIEDCFTTLKLFNLMKMREWKIGESTTWVDHMGREFTANPRIVDCYEVDRRVLPLLRKMSKRGFAIREEVVRKWYNKLKAEMQEYDQWFSQLGFNPMSNDQMGYLLHNRGNYIPLTEGGKVSKKRHLKANEEVLRNTHDPMAYMILARRKRQKLFSTYIKPAVVLDEYDRLVEVRDRLWTHYRLDLATGRLGSWDINIQNQPPSMREMFAPDNSSGEWSWVDLHQAEMRVWAWEAQDPVMLAAFERGESPHDATLKALFPGYPKKNPDGSSTPQYIDAKGFNFSLLADASAEVMSKSTKRPVAVCQQYKDTLYELYWKSKQHQDYMRQRQVGWAYPDYVESDFGRRCHIPDGIDVTDTHQQKCRLNYPFQASVADVIKRIMLILDGLSIDFPGQVHDLILADEIKMEWPKELAEVHPAILLPFEESRGAVWI